VGQLADVFEIRADRERGGVAVRMQFNLEATTKAI
jgi:hypothetical protein